MVKNTYIKEKIDDTENMYTVRKHIEAYLAYLRSLKQSESTIKIRKMAVERFFSSLGVAGIGEVNTKDLDDHRLSLVEAGLSESTVDMHMRSLKGFFSWLEDNNLIFDNPFRLIKLRTVRRRCMEILSKGEIGKLLAAASTRIKKASLRNRAIIETLYSTGIRRGELSGMKIRDVDTAGRSVRVLGKGRKERILPLGKIAAECIDSYLLNCRPGLINPDKPNCDDLWLDMNGKKMSNELLQIMICQIGRRAGIARRVSCHMLRRTCATHMLMNGAHPLMISQMLGHSGLKTLSHYLNITQTELMKTHRKSKPGQ